MVTVIALVNTGDAIFEMFTEPMIGYFLDLTHRSESLIKAHKFSINAFHYAFAVLPIYLILSTILLIFIKPKIKIIKKLHQFLFDKNRKILSFLTVYNLVLF